MRRWARRYKLAAGAVGAMVFIVLGLRFSDPAAAVWPVQVTKPTSAIAAARAVPGAPTGVTATCTGLLSGQITVTWQAVAGASAYVVLQSHTASTGPYTVAASGVAGSPWTSPVLATGTYWFEVSAAIGVNWIGAASAPSASHSILVSLACA